MILGLIPMNFRFRGRLNRLKDIYQCFRDHPGKGLHPTQIARHTGMSTSQVSERLQATPELFVKLPGRGDGITRYRLTTATSARSPEQVEAFLNSQARKESLVLYAFGAMLLCLMLIVLVLIGPVL